MLSKYIVFGNYFFVNCDIACNAIMLLRNPRISGEMFMWVYGHNAAVVPPIIRPANAPWRVRFLPYNAPITKGPNALPNPDHA